MIPIPTGVRVWLATGHTDMRCGFPSLALRLQEVLKRDAMGGGLFCFRVSDVRVPFAKVWRGDCSLLINVFANRWLRVWRRQRRRITRCGRTTRAGVRRSGTAGDRLRSL